MADEQTTPLGPPRELAANALALAGVIDQPVPGGGQVERTGTKGTARHVDGYDDDNVRSPNDRIRMAGRHAGPVLGNQWGREPGVAMKELAGSATY